MDELTRWGIAIGTNVALGAVAVRLGWISGRGFVAGCAVGALIQRVHGWPGWALLVTFFVVGSAVTRYRYRDKLDLDVAQSAAGRRGAREALANTAVATLITVGAVALPHADWSIAYAAAFATALADTTASELGPLFGRTPRDPLTWRRTEPGREGAVSLTGSVLGAVGAVFIAAVGALLGAIPPRAIVPIVLAAVLASHLESMIGAIRRSGWWSDNEVQNLINTATGAVLGWGLVRGLVG